MRRPNPVTWPTPGVVNNLPARVRSPTIVPECGVSTRPVLFPADRSLVGTADASEDSPDDPQKPQSMQTAALNTAVASLDVCIVQVAMARPRPLPIDAHPSSNQ
ncbi:hypothetical protein ColTof4_02051 [Colletotrichum tofieldiae]|nr:hypothetical protein ColTof3_09664 [Colletotrichum tofieldiae]GKT69628.1 hypothetical protein ColTof4_02051 [Colletotrichum tofieldiae]